MKAVSLSCAGCGASLKVPAAARQVGCSYCGASHTVTRDGGAVSIELLHEIKKDTSRISTELEIARLKDDRQELRQRILRLNEQIAKEKQSAKSQASPWTVAAVIVLGLIVLVVGVGEYHLGCGQLLAAVFLIAILPPILVEMVVDARRLARLIARRNEAKDEEERMNRSIEDRTDQLR